MRLLIISEQIDQIQRGGSNQWEPPYDVQLDIVNLNNTDGFQVSVFDYDVTIVHITDPTYHSIGYYENIPKILEDTKLAIQHGRTVICLPGSSSFTPKRLDRSRAPVYDWLKFLGLTLQQNHGRDIQPVGAGRTKVIEDYLKYVQEYHQIVIEPEAKPSARLAVVNGTQIVVGLEHQLENGTLVILPPPNLAQTSYLLSMMNLMDVARRYYEGGHRHVAPREAPVWVTNYLVSEAKDLDDEIRRLESRKLEYDSLAYSLYGTGEDLENSVALLLGRLGLTVAHTTSGANIDLTANHEDLSFSFGVEVTGSTGAIRKNSNKVSQAWQYIHDRSGTAEESNKLIIVANTELHLDPSKRTRDSFSREVVQLLGDNGVLLITTTQLYSLWKAVHEENRLAEAVVQDLYSQSGLFDSALD